jgi:RND family efflux transporter MFP subunit
MSSNRWKLLSAVAAVLAVACHRTPQPQAKAGDLAPVRVSTIKVERSSWPETFEALGTVRARASSVLSPRVMAQVLDVRARIGDPVAQGQTLVVLDSRELVSAHKQAEAALREARGVVPEADSAIVSARAQLDLAQITHRRMQDLFSKRSVSQQELDEAAAKARQAQSAVDIAEARRRQLDEKIRQAEQAVETAGVVLGHTEIRSPFGGRVIARTVEPGTLASPGSALLEVEQECSYRLEAPVEESRIARVRRGQSAAVRLDGSGRELIGVVSEIVPAADPASRSITVKINLPTRPGLQSGLSGRATFTAGERSVVTVPAGAVIAQGQVSFVFVADQGVARSRLVRAGEMRGQEIEVLSGLEPGDRVIHPRPAALTDGARVELQP